MNSTCKELKYTCTCTCTVMEITMHYSLIIIIHLVYCTSTTNIHLKYSTLHCTTLYTFTCTYG